MEYCDPEYAPLVMSLLFRYFDRSYNERADLREATYLLRKRVEERYWNTLPQRSRRRVERAEIQQTLAKYNRARKRMLKRGYDEEAIFRRAALGKYQSLSPHDMDKFGEQLQTILNEGVQPPARPGNTRNHAARVAFSDEAKQSMIDSIYADDAAENSSPVQGLNASQRANWVRNWRYKERTHQLLYPRNLLVDRAARVVTSHLLGETASSFVDVILDTHHRVTGVTERVLRVVRKIWPGASLPAPELSPDNSRNNNSIENNNNHTSNGSTQISIDIDDDDHEEVDEGGEWESESEDERELEEDDHGMSGDQEDSHAAWSPMIGYLHSALTPENLCSMACALALFHLHAKTAAAQTFLRCWRELSPESVAPFVRHLDEQDPHWFFGKLLQSTHMSLMTRLDWKTAISLTVRHEQMLQDQTPEETRRREAAEALRRPFWGSWWCMPPSRSGSRLLNACGNRRGALLNTAGSSLAPWTG
jgi:hypothetical protein